MLMKTCFSPAILLARIICAHAVSEGKPASSNVGDAEYPRIESNLGVTFRLKAPNAKQVKIEGGAGLVKQPLDLVRGGEGTWTVTTPPAVSGFHYYWFTVDGLRANDPASYPWFGCGRETSGIEVPEVGVAPKSPGHGRTVDGQWPDIGCHAPASGQVLLDWRDERAAAAGLRRGGVI